MSMGFRVAVLLSGVVAIAISFGAAILHRSWWAYSALRRLQIGMLEASLRIPGPRNCWGLGCHRVQLHLPLCPR